MVKSHIIFIQIFKKVKTMNNAQRQLTMSKIGTDIDKCRTNHLLHLILSLFTFGFWIIIWILVIAHNIQTKKRLEKLSSLLIESANSN